MSSLNYKNFIKDTLRVHGSYTHYPFMFGFHPEFSCQKLREFGEFLKTSHKDFQFVKYSEGSGGCSLAIGENPWEKCTL